MPERRRRGIRYAHTNLVAADWRAMVKFYVEVFDCRPVGTERDRRGAHIDALTGLKDVHMEGIHLKLPGYGEGGPTLEVFQFDENARRPIPALNRPGFAHIAFQVDDLEEKRLQIKEWGGEDLGSITTLEIREEGRLTLIYMTDPEGNIVELQNWH